MQVPSVTISQNDKVRVVPLDSYLKYYEIEIIEA